MIVVDVAKHFDNMRQKRMTDLHVRQQKLFFEGFAF